MASMCGVPFFKLERCQIEAPTEYKGEPHDTVGHTLNLNSRREA